jgi:DhnA family fructose-bisphosphate aldolase class Ia
MSAEGIRVTIEDLATGEKEVKEITNDYLVVTAGDHYVAHTNWYPRSGTTQLTIRVAQPAEDACSTAST